jgi:DHA2 family multidrug resistance protein
VFYINLPVGIASVLMTRMFVFDPPYIQAQKRGVDYWGIGMLVVGIGALQIVLDKGQAEDWFASNFIVAFASVAAVALVALIVHELMTREPVIDLRVFKERSYSAGVFMMAVVGFVLYGSMVLLPIMLQTLLGYPAVQAGIAMAPRGIGSFLMMPVVGVLTARVDVRKLLAAGLTVGGVTLIWLGQLNLQAGYWDIFWPQFIQGSGMALLFVPLTTVTMASIPPERMGNATSLFNLMRNIGGSIGIAVTATIVSRQRQSVGAILGEHVTALDPGTQGVLTRLKAAFMAAGADAVTASERAYAALSGLLARQASMVSFVMLFRMLGILFLLMIPLVLIMRRPKKGSAAVGAH